MEIATILLTETTKVTANFVLDQTRRILSRHSKSATTPDQEIRISQHLTRVANWASTYNFLGLGKPKDSSSATIALRFAATPRRYRATKSSSLQKEMSEEAFLEDNYSAILLGDPGAGKTTTLKRLALTLLSEDAKSRSDIFQFPVMLLLRELPADKFICEELADIFGVKYVKVSRAGLQSGALYLRTDFDITVGNSAIEDVLAEILNAARALVLIDGLDELPYAKKESTEREIEALNSRLTSSKLIVSCRSGDYSANFTGFRSFEIAPLSESEIKKISHFWLDDPSPFLSALRKAPYADIVDRPLLLSFILYLFGLDGELPEQPSLIYRKVVYRLLKEWDEERRIARSSKYAHFDPDRKIDFLSELAYYLTYEVKGKSFNEGTFEQTYHSIAPSFKLPTREYRQVASEIETHTGIIVAAGIDKFEFAHLSIQEFLCANYICRSPYPDLLKKYLSEYPAPVAVACALSSNPSMFFTEMIIRHLIDKLKNPDDSLHGDMGDQLTLDLFGLNTSANLKSFLSRLLIENPYLKIDVRFGEALLCMFAFYYRRYSADVDKLLEKFLALEASIASLRLAIEAVQGITPFELTKETIIFEIDDFFRSKYEAVAGIWSEQLHRRLPPVLLPRHLFELVWRGKYAKRLDKDFKQRLAKSLSYTPFCLLDQGKHNFKGGLCDLCGFDPRDPRKRRQQGRFSSPAFEA